MPGPAPQPSQRQALLSFRLRITIPDRSERLGIPLARAGSNLQDRLMASMTRGPLADDIAEIRDGLTRSR
jgi:hypothetical protein